MEYVLQQQMSKNRKLFKTEMVTGLGQFTFVTGAFLAGFVDMLGGSDSLNGLIGTLPAIMGFMQIASALYFERLEKRKTSIMKIVTALRIMLALIYIIPILLMQFSFALEVFIIIYIIGFALNALLSPVLSDMLINSTPLSIRGKYFGQREKIAFFVTAIFSYVLGKVLDIYKANGHESSGFMIIGIFILIFGLINIFSVHRMDEITHEQKARKFSLKDAIILPFSSRGFRKVIILFILWNTGLHIGGPFIAVYLVTGLDVSYTYMMLLSIIGTIMRIIFAGFWGKLSDQKSWFLTLKTSLFILALTHFSWGFVDATNYKLLAPILFITGGFAWAGIGASLFNVQYMYANKEGRTMYIGLNAAIGGIISFIAVKAGGLIIDTFNGSQLTLGLFSFNNMQLVFVLSGLLLASCPIYTKYFLEKIPYND